MPAHKAGRVTARNSVFLVRISVSSIIALSGNRADDGIRRKHDGNADNDGDQHCR
jgi:hypothetical protein